MIMRTNFSFLYRIIILWIMNYLLFNWFIFNSLWVCFDRNIINNFLFYISWNVSCLVLNNIVICNNFLFWHIINFLYSFILDNCFLYWNSFYDLFCLITFFLSLKWHSLYSANILWWSSLWWLGSRSSNICLSTNFCFGINRIG